MHQLVATDTTGTRHYSTPAELSPDELADLHGVCRDLADLRHLRLETEDGDTYLAPAYVVSLQVVEA